MEKPRIICVVGSPGTGKSTIANRIGQILTGDPTFQKFEVGQGFNMESKPTKMVWLDDKSVAICDMKGFSFGNNSYEFDFRNCVADYARQGNCYFILVDTAAPRLSHLKSDMEYLRKLLGPSVLKSALFAIINMTEIENNLFVQRCRDQMKEVSRVLQESRGECQIEDCLLLFKDLKTFPISEESDQFNSKLRSIQPYVPLILWDQEKLDKPQPRKFSFGSGPPKWVLIICGVLFSWVFCLCKSKKKSRKL